jgi:hypothetical protein
MIQRVVRNGGVRAFGAEWELESRARGSARHGDRVHVLRVEGISDSVLLYMPAEKTPGLRFIGRATRRPVIDIMERLRESLAGSEKP